MFNVKSNITLGDNISSIVGYREPLYSWCKNMVYSSPDLPTYSLMDSSIDSHTTILNPYCHLVPQV